MKFGMDLLYLLTYLWVLNSLRRAQPGGEKKKNLNMADLSPQTFVLGSDYTCQSYIESATVFSYITRNLD